MTKVEPSRRMEEFDEKVKNMFLEATKRGEDTIIANERIKEETREEYLEILKEMGFPQ